MPIFAHSEPSENLSKMQRITKAVCLYLFDLMMFMWLIPRGVQLTIRLASMIFLKMTAVSVTVYVNYALVLTLQADRGLIPQSQLTMSTEQLLGLPQTGCTRARRSADSGWEEMLEKMAGEARQPVEVTIPEIDDSMKDIFNVTSPEIEENMKESFNVTGKNMPSINTSLVSVKISNDTYTNGTQAERDLLLLDAVVDIFVDYFGLNYDIEDENDLSPTLFDSEDGVFNSTTEKLLSDLVSKIPQNKKDNGKAHKKTKGGKKGKRSYKTKIFSRLDLKIIVAALLLTIMGTCFLLSGVLCISCCKSFKTQKAPCALDREEQLEEEEVEVTSL